MRFDLSLHHRRFIPYALLLIAVFAAYGNVYGNAFLLDDEFLILKNEYLRFWGALPKLLTSSSTAGFGAQDSFYRPLQGLLYFIIYQTAGLSLVGFHLLNVSLHAANACLLYKLGRKLNFAPLAALGGALVWAVHPVHTEAVAYMSATADPLYTLFCLASLCALLPSLSHRRMAAGCFLFALALLAKETAIVLPALAMICLFAAQKDRLNGRLHLKTWPLWTVAALYLVLRFHVLGLSDVTFYKEENVYSASLINRFLTFLATLPTYLRIYLWPTDLHMMRGFPVYTSTLNAPVLTGLAMTLGSLAVIGHALATRGKKFLALGWGLAWFAAAHALHTGVLWPVNAIIYEHWLYLPTAGLTLGVAQMIALAVNKRARLPIGTATAGIVMALAVSTLHYNTFWREPVVFYENILRYGNPATNVHNNLGMAYADRGEFNKAIEKYRAAIALSDTFAQPHHNIARALLEKPDAEQYIPEAIAELEKAIAINPRFFQSYELLAEIYEHTGDPAKARLFRAKAQAIRDSR